VPGELARLVPHLASRSPDRRQRPAPHEEIEVAGEALDAGMAGEGIGAAHQVGNAAVLQGRA
jgi:hypothetical protein